MPLYRLTAGKHARYEGERGEGAFVSYARGSEIELSDAELESGTFDGRIEPVGSESEAPESAPAKATPKKSAGPRGAKKK